MEYIRLIVEFILESVETAPFATKLALLALLVALLGLWVSFRALSAAEKGKTEKNLLTGINQKSALLDLLQESEISTMNAHKELKLSDFFISHLSGLLESNAKNSRDKIIIKIDEAQASLKKLSSAVKELERNTQELNAKVEALQETGNPDAFEKLFPDARALRNEAQSRFSAAEALHAEIKGYYDLILNEHLVLNIHKASSPPV